MKKVIKNNIFKFFKIDPENKDAVSAFRLYLMRFLFVITFVFLGWDAWREIITYKGVWEPMRGVAFSFWAAYSTLMILGLRYPLKMTPLLLLQFSYKLIWLIIVAYPLWSAKKLENSSAEEMTTVFVIGILIDLIVIPWSYVVRNYLL